MRFNWRTGATLFLIGALGACTTTPDPNPFPGPVSQGPVQETPEPEVGPEPEAEAKEPEITEAVQPEEQIVTRDGLTPPHMAGRNIKRLALLLPFSSSSQSLRSEAASMLKAAELAVFERDEADVLLIALDTQGTESGAASATRAAVQSGADVILGPVLARAVTGSSREARRSGTPVLAFSTDQTVAGNGTYLLSFPPEAEVDRIVQYTAQSGAQNFAYLGPDSTYGRRVKSAYGQAVQNVSARLTHNETYDGDDISVMQAPARRLAEAYKNSGSGRLAFEAIMLPEGGTPLRSLAPLLPYYDVDPDDVQFMGTSLWHRDETVREPALDGGIFAGPDREARQPFLDAYDRRYGEDAGRLASLAFDAVNVGAFVADGRADRRQSRIEDRQGFYGVDGLIQFDRDGTPNRGLAVYQIQNGRFVVIDPAPRTVTGPS